MCKYCCSEDKNYECSKCGKEICFDCTDVQDGEIICKTCSSEVQNES